MNYVMYPHNGCYNRGCEAIVRSTCAILGKDKSGVYLYSHDTSNDIEHGLNNITTLIDDKVDKWNVGGIRGFYNRILEKMTGTSRDVYTLAHMHRTMHVPHSIALSIGGDNYCYKGMQSELSEKNLAFDHWKIPRVLWGCSMSGDQLTERTIAELRGYRLITVRETISQQILSENGIRDNVVLCSDPAFSLPEQVTMWPDPTIEDRKIIGINASALAEKYESYPGATYGNIRELIRFILDETDYNIALIPHVMHANGNNDLIPSRELYDEVGSPKLFLIDSRYNCMQLKSLISKCEMFIGCRTHSIIAAYSTCVPALAVGYSVKSAGIAKDIFGDEPGLVVPVQSFTDNGQLARAFIQFAEKSGEIRNKLQETMPGYVQNCYQACEYLKKIG